MKKRITHPCHSCAICMGRLLLARKSSLQPGDGSGGQCGWTGDLSLEPRLRLAKGVSPMPKDPMHGTRLSATCSTPVRRFDREAKERHLGRKEYEKTNS